MAVKPVVICLSRAGEGVAHKVAALLDAPVHGRTGRVEKADAFFANALDHVRDLFAARVPVVGVCAAGILIRAVAPLLVDKRAEPPLLAVSDDGAIVVPLLGGHRGANRLARLLAEGLGAKAAVTTAGDVALGVVLDEPPAGWVLENPQNAKAAMMALLQGGGARICGDAAAKADWLVHLPQGEEVDLICSLSPCKTMQGKTMQGETMRETTLIYRPQRAVLGVGCARNCRPDELIGLVDGLLAAAEIAPKALKAIATLDLKADEPAMLELSKHLGLPLRLFTATGLEAETGRTQNPSKVVFSEVGTHGVAENAALAAAGPEAVLLHPKVKSAMATAALSLCPQPIVEMPGTPRGKLSIIGIGPGQSSWRTPEASQLVQEADELVGYGLYIDLLGPLAAGKLRTDYPLGSEEDRCRYALERAGKGANVALICSGDAGIYAMGALVFELLDRGPEAQGVSDAARRIEVVSAPGVSALQGAAARAGAPLGHDFCAISLSDLLTPRADILKRLKAAAEGDFVIALYNPVSKKRRILLAEARDILLAHRPAHTPVMLASNLGRLDEHVRYRRLDQLQVDEVDMLTVVLIGSSNSKLAMLGEGPRMYTPRGYARRIDGDLS